MRARSRTITWPVIAGAVLLWAAPASAAQRPRCEARPGKTLAASPAVRVYASPRTKLVDTQIAACAVGSRRVSYLAIGRRSVKQARIAIRGTWIAAVDSAWGTAVGHTEDLSINTVSAVDVHRPASKWSSLALSGCDLTDIVVGADGSVAVLGRPFGRAYTDEEGDDGTFIRTTSTVAVAHPLPKRESSQPWQVLDDAPDLTGLALSGSTLVWQHGTELRSAPLAAPPVT